MADLRNQKGLLSVNQSHSFKRKNCESFPIYQNEGLEKNCCKMERHSPVLCQTNKTSLNVSQTALQNPAPASFGDQNYLRVLLCQKGMKNAGRLQLDDIVPLKTKTSKVFSFNAPRETSLFQIELYTYIALQ